MKNVEPAMRTGIFVVAVIAIWFVVAVLLWWAYDFRAFIRGGAYTQQSALTWVCEFAAIISVIVGAVWVISIVRKKDHAISILAIGLRVLWRTGFALLVYAVIIIARRSFPWMQGRGQDDWSMFFGRVNAEFFSETGPLSFLLEVLPATSLISALAFVAQETFVRRLFRNPNTTTVVGE